MLKQETNIQNDSTRILCAQQKSEYKLEIQLNNDSLKKMLDPNSSETEIKELY